MVICEDFFVHISKDTNKYLQIYGRMPGRCQDFQAPYKIHQYPSHPSIFDKELNSVIKPTVVGLYVYYSRIHVYCSRVHVYCSRIHVYHSRVHVYCSRVHVYCSRIHVYCSRVLLVTSG